MKSRKWAACILWCNFFFKLKARKSFFKIDYSSICLYLDWRKCWLYIVFSEYVSGCSSSQLRLKSWQTSTPITGLIQRCFFIIYTQMIMRKTFCGRAHLRSDWGVGYSWFKFVRQTNRCGRVLLKKFLF